MHREREAVGIVAFCVCVSVFGDKESRLRRKKTKTLARASTSPLSPIFLSSSSSLSLSLSLSYRYDGLAARRMAARAAMASDAGERTRESGLGLGFRSKRDDASASPSQATESKSGARVLSSLGKKKRNTFWFVVAENRSLPLRLKRGARRFSRLSLLPWALSRALPRTGARATRALSCTSRGEPVLFLHQFGSSFGKKLKKCGRRRRQ